MTANDKPLRDKLVAISISGNSDLAALGYTEAHLHDLSVRLARKLLGLGASIAYGGFFGDESLTKTLHRIARNEVLDHPSQQPKARLRAPFVNYLAWPFYEKLTKELEVQDLGVCTYVRVADRVDDTMTPTEQKDLDAAKDKRASHALSRMRRWLAADADAAILVGGKRERFMGLMPGVLEEALCHIEADNPLYTVGGFGGIAADLAVALRNQQDPLPPALTRAGRVGKRDFDDLLAVYPHIVQLDHDLSHDDAKASYPRVQTALAKLRVSAGQNGLSPKEDRALWVSEDIEEIVDLIYSGLEKTLGRRLGDAQAP